MQPNEPGTNPSANVSTGGDESHKFLLFRLGEELYGCSLTMIKEVIKLGPLKPVPYMVSYFKGVLNLRGKIIGVIDLSQKLGLRPADAGRLILIVEGVSGTLGVIVDEVLSVENVVESQIATGVDVQSRIAPQFFQGIASINERLVHIVRIADMISEEEYRTAEGRKVA